MTETERQNYIDRYSDNQIDTQIYRQVDRESDKDRSTDIKADNKTKITENEIFLPRDSPTGRLLKSVEFSENDDASINMEWRKNHEFMYVDGNTN